MEKRRAAYRRQALRIGALYLGFALPIIACKGPTGPAGPAGQAGEAGVPGEPGASGELSEAVVCEANNELLYGIDVDGNPMCRVDQTAEPGGSGVASIGGLRGDINLSSTDDSVAISANEAEHRIDLRARESDPVFATKPAADITAGDVARWNAAHTWGDHNSVGYLSNLPMVWLEQFGAVPVSGAPPHDESHAAANVAALEAALAALPNGGKVFAGPGIFYLDRGVEITTNIWVQGAGMSNPDEVNNKGIGGTVFRPTTGANIPKLFYTRVGTRAVRLSDFTIVGGRFGPVYTATVGAAVHLLGIAHTAERLQVSYISGDGIWVGDRSIAPPPYYWIFWLRNNRVSNCGGFGLRVESTDGFIVGNYSGDHAKGNISYGGGNIWTANHFDNAKNPAWAALTVENQRGVATTHITEQIVANYFDVSAIGLRFAGTAANPVPFRATVSGNYFRGNSVLDIYITGCRNPVIDNFTSNRGGANHYSLKFENCAGSTVVRNATWDDSWPTSREVVDPSGQPMTHCIGCFQDGTLLSP